MTERIRLETAQHGAVPLLFARAEDEEGRVLPTRGTVLFLHGLSASKDLQRPDLERLAQAGYLAIGVDAPGHGDRYSAGLHRELTTTPEPARRHRIAALVREASRELPGLVTHLFDEGWASSGKLGAIGVSFGAYILYRTLLHEGRITAAVAMIGSPDLGIGEPDSPHASPSRFFPTALLSVGAGRDGTVPPGPARAFHEALAPHYASAPERQRHLLYPESEHMMREEDWNAAWGETLRWFGMHLRG